MELTLKKSLDICKELWRWCKKTGGFKEDWPGWEKYGEMRSDCPLCERDSQNENDCESCPLYEKYGGCWPTFFTEWCSAKTIEDRKKYAGLFLEQLLTLK